MSSEATDLDIELERAQALCELARFGEATTLLQELLAREPDNAPAWCLLAQAQLGADQLEEGLDAASRATALAPEWEWPHRLRSIALGELGDEEGAIAAAREAVRTGPHKWQTLTGLAAQLTKRDLNEAAAVAERAVALAPNEPYTHFTLGRVTDARGKHNEAEEHFRRALALDPQHSLSHGALALRKLKSSGFGRAGNLADAAAGFRDAVQADPTADYGATGVEVALRVFLARLSYLIFVIAWFASRDSGGSIGARLAPFVGLAIPVVFASRFLRRLKPDLRRHLFYIAFHGKLAVASIAQACALTLLILSAAAPADARTGLGIVAVVISLCARLLLSSRVRGPLVSVGNRRNKRLRA